MLRRKATEFSKVAVSKRFRQLVWQQAQNNLWLYNQLEGLATLKRKRDPRYVKYCERLLVGLAEANVGHLPELPPDALLGLEKLIDVIVAVMSGRKPPDFTGPEFATMTKRLFVPPKKPGPHPVSKYDEAFIRRTKGERLSRIIKDLEPETYAKDPYGTTQRYSAAIRLRKKRASQL